MTAVTGLPAVRVTVDAVRPGPGGRAPRTAVSSRDQPGAGRPVLRGAAGRPDDGPGGRAVARDDADSAAAEFEAFFRAHHRDLSRVAYALTGSHAEADDVVADALASAWRHWPRVRAADSPSAYVRRAVVNLAASRVRRRIHERRGSALLGPLTAWLHHGPDVDARVDLQHAVLALPPRRRACVVLRHVVGLSTAEVAQTLDITEGAVKSQLWKGLDQLRRDLGRAHAEAAGGTFETEGGQPA